MNTTEEVSDKILKVAKALFYTHGYKKVTMDDIAKELKMSKKTIYKYHEGKYAILLELIGVWKRKVSTSIESLLRKEDVPYADKLKGFLILVGTNLSDVSQVFMLDMQRNMPEIWAEITEYKRDAAYNRFLSLIEGGKQAGYIAAEVNTNIVVALYASAIENLLNPVFCAQLPKEVYAGFPEKPLDVFEQILAIILDGVLVSDKKMRSC